MSLWELFVIAVGLSMDAFAVSICKGLSVRRCTFRHMLICGLYFGLFQGGMPLIGYILGSQFESMVSAIAPYIAFILLGFIGMNMIKESREEEEECCCDDFSVRAMIPLAVATSIDALAVGVTFAFLGVQIVPAVLFIGIVTFVLSGAGVKIGNVFGSRFEKKAQITGGVILILLGVKILLEHLGVL